MYTTRVLFYWILRIPVAPARNNNIITRCAYLPRYNNAIKPKKNAREHNNFIHTVHIGSIKVGATDVRDAVLACTHVMIIIIIIIIQNDI